MKRLVLAVLILSIAVAVLPGCTKKPNGPTPEPQLHKASITAFYGEGQGVNGHLEITGEDGTYREVPMVAGYAKMDSLLAEVKYWGEIYDEYGNFITGSNFSFTIPPGLSSEEVVELDPLSLKPVIPGAIIVRSDPSGANVLLGKLDGEMLDQEIPTPATLWKVPPGEWVIGLQLKGYHYADTTVVVESDKTTEVFLTLIPLPGAINITTIPQGATVLLDGVEMGTSPITLPNLPPGSHTLKLLLEGHEDREEIVVVEIGRTTRRSVKMVPLPKVIKYFPEGESEWIFDGICFNVARKMTVIRNNNVLMGSWNEGWISDYGEIRIRMFSWTLTGNFDPNTMRIEGTAVGDGGTEGAWWAGISR